MSKINAYLFILIIFSILFLIQSDETPKQETEQKNEKEQEQENNDDDNDEYFDEDGERYFRESLKKYLIEKNLLESDQLIQPEEMKKIFLEVVTEGDAESAADYFSGIFIELADHFVNEYYRNKTEIRGKDIYDLINMDQISAKFEQLMNENSKYNGADDHSYEDNNDYNDYDNDYDYRDDIGDPILDH